MALQIIDRVIQDILSEEEIINLLYLKLETLMSLGEYYKVRDIADDMINRYPVKGDELYSLLYIKAEAYLELKQYKQAYSSFNELNKIKSEYRLVNKRLKELEKYK